MVLKHIVELLEHVSGHDNTSMQRSVFTQQSWEEFMKARRGWVQIQTGVRRSHSGLPGVRDETLNRDEGLVPHIGVLVRHELHYSRFATKVGNRPKCIRLMSETHAAKSNNRARTSSPGRRT